jgi:predicted PurR-regulated permease PerM
VERKVVRQIFALIAASIVLLWALMNHETATRLLRWGFAIIGPLVGGGAIAFILNVPVRSLERRVFKKGPASLRRSLAMVTTFLFVLLVFSLLLLIVIPELVSAIEQLSANLPGLIDSVRSLGESLGERFPDLGFWLEELNISWPNVKSDVLDFLKRSSSTLVGSTVGMATNFINGIVNFILGLVFAVYMLARKEQLARQVKRLLSAYLSDNRVKRLLHAGRVVDTTFSNFVSGEVIEATILGFMFLVSMLIFRFPYAVLVSALVGVLALIPIVGAFIAATIGILLMLVTSPMQALWFLVLFLVLQQIEGNFVYPRIVGDSIGLPALWVLAAVMIGGNLFGILGMLVGVPVAAVLYVLLREAVAFRLEQGGVDSDKSDS